MDTVCCPLILTATCSLKMFSHFLDLFSIFRVSTAHLLPPPPPPPTPTPSPLPPSLFPSRWGSQLRIIAFDRRGLWLQDWALAAESTGSILPIPTFVSYCAWWKCWHSTCSPTGLIKSVASIWMQGPQGLWQHGRTCTTVLYTLHMERLRRTHTHKYKQSLQIVPKDSIKHHKKRPEQWHAHLHLTRRHEMWRDFGEVWCAKKSQDWLWQQLLHFRMVKECCMIFYSSNCVRRRFLLCSHFHAQLLSTSISLLQLQPPSPMFTSLHGG